MTKTRLFCRECGLVAGTDEFDTKAVQKLRRAYIRKNVIKKKATTLKHAKYQTKWVAIGWFCPRCNRLVPNKKIDFKPVLTHVFADFEQEKLISF